MLHWLVLGLALAATAALVLSGRGQNSTSPYSAEVSWQPTLGAVSARVLVDHHLVDQFATAGGGSYEVHGLWPDTRYRLTVEILGRRGRVLDRRERVVRTPRASGSVPRLYSDSAFINRPVGSSPKIWSNSAQIVASALTPFRTQATFLDGAPWGIPVLTADAHSSRYTVGCRYYWCDKDFGQLHIPSNAAPNTGSDGHMIVLQPNGDELDMWIGQHTSQGWSAAARWVESASGPAGNCTVAHECGGADAANFALGAGLVRPEEIAQGHIDHALALTDPDTRQGYIACPATGGDGTHTNAGALPIGAHVQLDPAIDVAQLDIPRWQKVIAVALQKYGAYVTDTGGSIGVYAQSNQGRGYDAWAKAGVSADSPSLADLPWSSMRVLNMTRCG